jgi:hypothetical protein
MNGNFYSDLRRPSVQNFERWLSERLKSKTEDHRLVFNTMMCLEYITFISKVPAIYGILLIMAKEWCREADIEKGAWHGKYVYMLSNLSPKYVVYQNGEFLRLETSLYEQIQIEF